MKIKEAYAKALNDHPFWTILITGWAVSGVIRAMRGEKATPVISISDKKPEIQKQMMEGYW